MGLIQFRKTSDTRYAMRTQFKGNPLKSLPASRVDLDNPDHLNAFIEYIAPGSSTTGLNESRLVRFIESEIKKLLK